MIRNEVSLWRQDGWTVAVPEGDIDLGTVEDLASRIERGVGNDSSGLVLDLSRVTYLDSTGLRLLFRLSRQLASRQQALRVVVPPDSLLRPLLSLAGVGSAVPLFSSSVQALEHRPST